MPKQQFHPQEHVLAEDKGRIYEARILKVQNCSSTWQYFIHYVGWAAHTDVWCPEEKIKKLDPSLVTSGRKRSGFTIKSESSTDTSATIIEDITDSKKRKSVAAPMSDEAAAKKKRLKQLMQSEICDDDIDVSTTKLVIPSTLKIHLVDEWDLIVQEPRKLLKLPRTPNVVTIIEEFLSLKKKKADDEQYARYVELFAGLRIYFDKALSKVLLYRQERDQWSIAKNLHTSPSQIYGAEHLLRLYVKFPKLLSQVTLSASELNQAQSKFLELLNYMQKNSENLISKGDYIPSVDAMKHLESISCHVNGGDM